MRANARSTGRRLAASVLVFVVTVVVAGVGSAGAAVGDIGYEGASYKGATNPPTSDKPQSKLWYNDGFWWADMFSAVTGDWQIYRLDRGSETWVDTGTKSDTRDNSLADVLWDGTHLYIASHYVSLSSLSKPKAAIQQQSRLYRYSYSAVTRTYTLDSGFPTQITPWSSESLTIDKDSTGRMWATWTQVSGSSTTGWTNTVYVNSTVNGDRRWGTPTVMPAAGANPSVDDISAVVAYGQNRVGVMWSNQLDDTMYWAWRNDSEPESSWHAGIAVRGSHLPDDHMNLKTLQADSAGRVFAAVKTSLDEVSSSTSTNAQLNLLVFKPATGSWSSTLFGTVADCHTRPLVLLDTTNSQVHVFATAPTASGCPYAGAPGTIYEKSAPLDNPTFPSGRGTAVIRDASSENMNNVTSTKQSVNAQTGLVVLASNDSTERYWHADISLGSAPLPPAPTASFTASPTSGQAPLAVQLTDTSTGSPTSWSWDLGDGTTSTAQNPTVTYQSGGTYTVTLVASNAGGPSAPVSTTITVTAPTGAPTASFTAAPTSGQAPLAVQLTDTSTGSPTSWSWDFGDGTTSTAQNPTVTYQSAGTYTVTLIASNASGSSAPATTTVTVTPAAGPGIVRESVATTAVTTAANGITIAKPSGTAAGDVLVACLSLNGSNVTSGGVPAGWSLLAASTTISNPKVYGYYRVATSSEPADYHWTFGASITSGGGIARYSGSSGPDVTATKAAGAAATSGTVPGVTTTTAGDMVVGCMGVNSGSLSVTITPPSGTSEAWSIGGKRNELADDVQPGAGPSGDRTWTFSASREWAGWLTALRPA